VVDLGAKRVLYSLPGLVRYLRRERPSAMLSALDHANVVALWAKKLAGVPTRVVLSVHNPPSLDTANAQTFRAKLMPLWGQIFYPWAHTVVAVSQGVAKDLVQLTGLPMDKVKVIYNPAVTPELLAKAEEALDHPWFQPGEPPVILGAGRLTAQKDFPTLIRAFALVQRKLPSRLMILSEGEERPRLEALVQELGLEADVALPGFVDNPYKYMKHAGVFVLSSRYEGFGLVLVEAMACGTPVVATDCPSGPSEILQRGRWGMLVPVGDIQEMAMAILEVFQGNKIDAHQRSLAFSIDRIVRQYAEILCNET
jgi:glycosyltransferase involved in cell wall biosynthesis